MVTYIPRLGLGIYNIPHNNKGKKVIKKALKIGYRLFNTSLKKDEKFLGTAFNSIKNKPYFIRKEIFVITRIGVDDIVKGESFILTSIKETLANINIDYIDLLLMENVNSNMNLVCWNILENICDGKYKELDGKIKHIGIYNFDVNNIKHIVEHCTIMPFIHQFYITPYFVNYDIVNICKKYNIQISAFSALVDYSKNKILLNIGSTYNVTDKQIILRWCVQNGYITIIECPNIDLLEPYFSLNKFCLSPQDFDYIRSKLTNKNYGV